ncbi:hypothetical protein HOP50_01g02110 [Chloropicon primus]|uniref:Adhesin domain-containing protein n=1 Tax=Chloropicon primus TaxID=1764295 RepID=A0A5B8MBJ4_9CHLO|nr:hypothetical protein A3770_01p02210 [Chloropicon primus]UPQ96920.1 hypothetical protein HOP50_01g02110 [Chloropicon primus]|mmetsp:Transcript_12488/g.34785  ORF Transcript_12488/g.34785 Transcript_12488/m.34785 type:complete len:371 (-) Transcript_12488:434-1546(-)|eukprot:QDZ17703.1 hypothetical protein A3770_01p02210 [Chloropicon primus]
MILATTAMLLRCGQLARGVASAAGRPPWSTRVAPVPPNTLVDVLGAPSGDVSVGNGDHDAVELSLDDAPGTAPDPRVSIGRQAGDASGKLGPLVRCRFPPASSPGSPQQLRARIPERYCSLRLRAPGGGASVEGVAEAGLDLRARDAARVRSVRGSVVSIESERGDVVADSVSGSDLSLRATRGLVEAKKVVGLLVRVSAAKGASLRSLYAEEASVESEGGDVALGNAGCRSLLVNAGGGAVKVDGVSGNLRVAGGKACSVNLSRDCKKVEILGVEGEVRVTAEPGRRIKCSIDAEAVAFGEGVTLDEDGSFITVEGEMGARAPRLEGEDGAEEADRELAVTSPKAKVVVSGSSWLTDILKKRGVPTRKE